MHDEHPHPLLAQVPLTLSPFLSLPTSVPLPYSYKSLPSTLPPSILSSPQANSTSDQPRPESSSQHQQTQQPPPYVVSATGTSATPDQILSSCVALQQHLAKLESDARGTLKAWEDKRRAEDLAEKRRLAPGWLDNDVHILRPEDAGGEEGRSAVEAQPDLMDTGGPQQGERKENGGGEGEELDRVFGGLKV